MGLIKYKTNLTSLKFGKDRPGGGSSNQPFITKDIPEKRSNNSSLINEIAGGSVLKITRSADDISRISQFLFSTIDGFKFTINQNSLSRSQVDFRGGSKNYSNIKYSINGGIYNPLNTVAQVGEVAFGSHYPKQGLNVGTSGEGLLGGIIGMGLDILGIKDNNGLSYIEYYENKTKDEDKSRLRHLHEDKGFEYKSPKSLEPSTTDAIINDQKKSYFGAVSNYLESFTGLFSSNNKIKNKILLKDSLKNKDNTIYSYIGGPGNHKEGSLVTRIKFSNELYKSSNYDLAKENFIIINEKIKKRSTENYLPLNILSTLKLGETNLTYNTAPKKTNGINVSEAKFNSTNPNKTGNEEIIKGKGDYYYPKIIDFRDPSNPWSGVSGADMTDNRIRMKDPTYRRQELSKIKDDKKKIYDFTRTSYIVDEINASGILNELDSNTDDLIKFRIGLINRKTGETKWVKFRAFIDSFSDNYSAQWNDYKFMGRGEKFYKYDGFDRSIDLNFTVAALSRPELIPMYKKLNWVASLMAPDYGKNGYMSGNIITLTIGGYLYEVKGILQGMTIAPHEESTWEIGLKYNGSHQITSKDLEGRSGSWDHSVKELPHVIKVTGFKFAPIHDFTPRLQKPELYETGEVRFISLAKGVGKNDTNYESKTSFDLKKIKK